MPCDHVKLPGGARAIVCGGRRQGKKYRCVACHLAGGFQCDWKASNGKTCDAYICREHALEVARDKHICPAHREAYEAWLAEQLKTATG